MYNDTALQPPTSVSLDGQTATLIDSGGTTSTTQVAIYKVSGFATGAGKTLAYTVGASGAWFGMDIAIDYRDGTPTYGAHATSSATGGGPASTSGLANTSGDEFISIYCSRDTDGTQNPSVGTGQSKLDETWDSAGSIRYGFSTETGTGAADVQTIAAGGTGSIPSIAATVVGASTPAGFTTGPTYSKVDNNTVRATFTCNSGTPVARIGLYAPGATAPTGAQVAAGTNARGTASAMCTGSSQTLDVDTSDSPAFPKYDPYMTLDSSGSYTTPPATSTQQLDPPSTCGASSNQACQYVTLSSVAVGGIASVATLAYDGQTANFVVGETVTGGTSGAVAAVQADTDAGATGTLTLGVSSGTFQDNETITGSIQGVAVVNGTATYLYAANDVLVAPTYVSPAGASYPLTIGADGNAVYDTVAYDGGSGRATATNIKIYDYSAVAYASNDIDWVNRNVPPDCAGNALQLVLLLNVPMTALDLDTLCTDAEGDTLNSIVLGTLPTGVTLNGTTNVTSGTPTVANTSGLTVTYVVYDTSGAIGSRRVIYYPLSTVAAPDCTTLLTTIIACSNAFDSTYISTNTFHVSQACSSIAAGYVISQDPVAGELAAPYSTVTIVSSLGACNDATVPNCLSKTSTQCLTLLNAASPYAVLTASTCSASAKIFSQTPAANAQAAYNFTLTALCH